MNHWSAEEQETFHRFRDYYAASDAPAIRELERRVLGIDYGGNSYTTVDQARQLPVSLDLGPTATLLDIGTGAGWPGLFVAQTAGCRVVLTDVPVEGLHTARRRAERERIDARTVVASGTHLPFRADTFDAVCHSDVVC